MRRLLKLAVLLVGILGVALAALAADAYLAYRAETVEIAPPAGPIAVWAEHGWVGQARDAAAYESFAAQIRRYGITDVFVHVGPLDGDGTIPRHRHPNAHAFIEEMRRRLPDLRIHAWIGQRERAGGGPLDLGSAAVRANIVRTAMSFLAIGFDGIHYNIEPIFSGDPHLLALLGETRSAMAGSRGMLSLATYEMAPFPGAARLLAPFGVPLWSRDYYKAVIARVDQAAVMMYDTGLPRDWLFAALVAAETRQLVDLVGDRATLFMGVPSYEDKRWNFDPAAENMISGLRGIRMGLAGRDPGRISNFGVAIYARWTTGPQEWTAFRRLWLGQP